MRPGPYEHLVDDAVFDGARPVRAEAAAARGVDMATLAFAWVLAHPGVDGAVCGPNRAEHLDAGARGARPAPRCRASTSGSEAFFA